MDLKDLTCEEGLLQDQWSTKELSFGAANQLVVIGYTETTWVYNLDKIVEIYERNGGLKK